MARLQWAGWVQEWKQGNPWADRGLLRAPDPTGVVRTKRHKYQGGFVREPMHWLEYNDDFVFDPLMLHRMVVGGWFRIARIWHPDTDPNLWVIPAPPHTCSLSHIVQVVAAATRPRCGCGAPLEAWAGSCALDRPPDRIPISSRNYWFRTAQWDKLEAYLALHNQSLPLEEVPTPNEWAAPYYPIAQLRQLYGNERWTAHDVQEWILSRVGMRCTRETSRADWQAAIELQLDLTWTSEMEPFLSTLYRQACTEFPISSQQGDNGVSADAAGGGSDGWWERRDDIQQLIEQLIIFGAVAATTYQHSHALTRLIANARTERFRRQLALFACLQRRLHSRPISHVVSFLPAEFRPD